MLSQTLRTTSDVIILGSTGMIGSGVTRYLSEESYPVTEANRNAIQTRTGNKVISFDAAKDNIENFVGKLPSGSTILNFIGVIRHKIDDGQVESVANAIDINGKFPLRLVTAAAKNNCRVMQIGTDCVFSGNRGNYSESSPKDPVDVYGQTKLQGETISENLMTLRVSVVGKEWKNHIELMDWVLNTKINGELNGYTNHFWNGITSLQLAKVISGILEVGNFQPGTFHLVPQDKKSKFDLVTSIAQFSGRKDLKIQEFTDSASVDRTLTTQFPELNRNLWGAAGFSGIPTIDLMLEEYFNWDRNQL